MPVWTKGASVPLPEDDLKRLLIKKYDVNKDGRLSKEELSAFFGNLGSICPNFRAYCAMHHADHDGDGFIDPDEMNELVSCAPSTRSRTKVQMQGVAIGRAVDLTVLNGYDELIIELEKMFDIKGQVQTQSRWAVVFTDDEGDMMLVGDDPWLEFCKMVKKISIHPIDEVKKMNPKCRIPTSSPDGECLVVHLDSELKSEA
ncbi:hypothetical protein Ancab_013034 [Ancistrocladus abbreviatus]